MVEFSQGEFEQVIAAILAAGAASSAANAHYNYKWILAEIRKEGLDAPPPD